MDIRLASSTDIPLITALAHRIWWAHYPEIISGAQIEYMLARNYSAASLQQQMDDGQALWLLESEGVPFGFVGISRTAAGSYFIHKFYVDPARQGSGVGSRAFFSLLAQYPDADTIRLLVNRQNFKSVNFYFKVGFIIEKCLETPIGEGFVMDDFQMLYRKNRQ